MINLLKSWQNNRHVADCIFERPFLKRNFDNLVYIPAGQWMLFDDKPLSEPTLTKFRDPKWHH